MTVSPTFIFESPSVSTTSGSPSFSRYKKVPDPSFSTTKTLLSQVEEDFLFTNKCSGLTPSVTWSPELEVFDVLGIIISDDQNKSTFVLLVLLLRIFVLIKFIFGEPIKPPTNKLLGLL